MIFVEMRYIKVVRRVATRTPKLVSRRAARARTQPDEMGRATSIGYRISTNVASNETRVTSLTSDDNSRLCLETYTAAGLVEGVVASLVGDLLGGIPVGGALVRGRALL